MSAVSQLTLSSITSNVATPVEYRGDDHTCFGKNSAVMRLSFHQLPTNVYKFRQHVFSSKSPQPHTLKGFNGDRHGSETVSLHLHYFSRSQSSRQFILKASVNGSEAAFIADGVSISPKTPVFGGNSLPDDISAPETENGVRSGVEVPASETGAWPLESGVSGTIAGIDQSDLKSVKDLSDSDSLFVPFRGVDIHYKQAEPFSQPSPSPSGDDITGPEGTLMLGTPAVLLHGFGASLYSWNRLLSPLATLLGSPALAFDRPAFGLTERVKPPGGGRWGATPSNDNPYGATFSADCTRAFSSYLISVFPPRPQRKVVLVAHSAGAAIAAQAVLESPTLVAALVLIGPALAPPLVSPLIKGKQYKGALWPLRLAVDAIKALLGLVTVRAALGFFTAARYVFRAVRNLLSRDVSPSGQDINEESDSSGESITKVSRRVEKTFSSLALLAYARVSLVAFYVGKNLQRLLHLGWIEAQGIRKAAWASGLRSGIGRWMVREAIARGGTRGVKMAWADQAGCVEEVLNGYTKPLRCRNWDRALIELILANSSNPPVASRLSEIGCPVLIITGDKDRIVPAWNAKRLANALPKAKLVTIHNCGHLPHEEKAAEVIEAIRTFMSETFVRAVVDESQYAALAPI